MAVACHLSRTKMGKEWNSEVWKRTQWKKVQHCTAYSLIRPLTHAAENGSRNLRHRPRRQSTMLEDVSRHEKPATESGVESRPVWPISGAGFWSVCQGPKEWTSLLDIRQIRTDKRRWNRYEQQHQLTRLFFAVSRCFQQLHDRQYRSYRSHSHGGGARDLEGGASQFLSRRKFLHHFLAMCWWKNTVQYTLLKLRLGLEKQPPS